jgi:L-amino acid N-acyltransferase YncA
VNSASSQPHVVIRRATVDDAAGIAEIYNAEVLNSTSTMDMVPRSIEEQREWIQSRSGAFSAIVACDRSSGAVLGFAALSKYKERAAYSTTVEDSVYVSRQHHGQGIGHLLLSSICDTAREGGFHSVIARIEASGEGSLALHRSVGFELLGIERQVGRKFNRWLDVAVMQLML